MKTSQTRSPLRRTTIFFVAAFGAHLLSGCVTSRVEEARHTYSGGIEEGEAVVILARRQHTEYETESGFTACVGDALASGSDGLETRSEQEFLDGLFPWFEPRLAPATPEALPELLAHPGVADRIADTGVRYVVWLDGETETVDGGGSISCDIGGLGCLGFQWWEKDSNYEASIWDLKTASSAGTISADVNGTSYMPAVVVPIPLIARTKAAACKGLAQQLRDFLIVDAR